MNHYYAAIMAGGVGTRFWPVSRQHYPKQFLDILNSGQTFLQATFARFASFLPAEQILVVSSEEYKALIIQQLPDLPQANILCEPLRKNTAPCMAYTAFWLRQKDPQASVICAPADHYIAEEAAFIRNCRQALDFAAQQQRYFVTLGIPPAEPHTGYGYIQYLSEETAYEGLLKVKTFTEKPSLKLAQSFIEDGDFLWNSGIFISYNAFLLEMFRTCAPELYDLFYQQRHLFNTEKEQEALTKIYPRCLNNSFDYEVMEKTKEVYVIKADFQWSDLGSWNSLYTLSEKDAYLNAVAHKKTLLHESSGIVLRMPRESQKLVVLQGLKDYVVVDTEDVLLICAREKEQEVKKYVEQLKQKKWEAYL